METQMIEKIRNYLKPVLIVGAVIIFFYWIWNLNPVEDFVGRWMAFLDPQRQEHLMKRYEKKSDGSLLKLLQSGDFDKSSVSATLLARRGDKENFEAIAKLLGSNSHEVRMSVRRILPHLDKTRASVLLMQELGKLDKNSEDYVDTLRMLVYMKHQPVYPYLAEYARRPDGWRNASAKYLAELGNPEAISILREMLTKVDDKVLLARSERERIQEAIKTLEAIAAQKKVELEMKLKEK